MTRRKNETVLAGFEVGTGAPVMPPLAHTFVAGQTQLSGKTTTLRAIVVRSGKRALAFVTKRGEEFEGRRIRPYLPREGDKPIHWRFVETILASALGQRAMKYERYWIVNAAKGAKSLQGVRQNVERLKIKAKGSTAETYELIGEYLDLVLPEMRELNAADELELQPGLNVIDLAGHTQQLQAMVIRACLAHINTHEQDVLTVFPEAWEFAPRGRTTPASEEAVAMARKGAVLGNFLLSDSQDIAGVDTTIRQAASVWYLGVQKELNELKRTLAMIPAGIKKPKPADITSLKIGQFIVCWGDQAVRTYVQPAWMNEADAIAIAQGGQSIDEVLRLRSAVPAATFETRLQRTKRQRASTAVLSLHDSSRWLDPPADPPQPLSHEEDDMSKEDVQAIRNDIGSLTRSIGELVNTLKRPGCDDTPADAHTDPDAADPVDASPAHLTLKTTAPVLTVEVSPRNLVANEDSPKGRVASLIADGFFQMPRIGNEAYTWWKARGFNQPSTRIYEALATLVKDGFLVMVDGKKYQQHPNLEVRKDGRKKVTLEINYK